MSEIQFSAKMKIIHDKLEKFKQQAAKCMSALKEKDPGTLQYDWFLSSDKTVCEIHETFESSEAFLARISNLREPLRTLFEKFTSDHSVVIYGHRSPQLLENAKSRGIDLKFFPSFRGCKSHK